MGVTLGKEVDIDRRVSELSPVVMVPGGVGTTYTVFTDSYSHRRFPSAVGREVPSTGGVQWIVWNCTSSYHIYNSLVIKIASLNHNMHGVVCHQSLCTLTSI